jgi:hypothetical protein
MAEVLESNRVRRAGHAVEDQIARVEPDTLMAAALGSIGLSIAVRLAGNRDLSQFIGHWVSVLVGLAVYDKLVREKRP